MWPEEFPRGPYEESIAAGEVYLLRRGGAPVGMLLLQWSDRELWGDVPEDAGYVHKLAVRRAYAGEGLGREMLRWAEGEAAAAGKRYLRLDCMADNPPLRAYYERAGFEPRGVVYGAGWSACLYEKRVGVYGGAR